MSKKGILLLCLMTAAVLIGVGGIKNASSDTLIAARPDITFTAAPSTIINGSSSILTWSSPKATACKGPGDWFYPLFGGNTSGSKAVSPGKTTEYSVTCKDSTNENTAHEKVFVDYTQSAHGYTIDIKVTNLSINGKEIINTPTDGPVTINALPDDSLRIRTKVIITDTNGLWPNLPTVDCVDWSGAGIINFDGTYADITRKVSIWTNNNTYNPLDFSASCGFQLADDKITDSVKVNVIAPLGPSPYTKTEVFLKANPTNLTLPVGGGSVYTDLTATVQCNVPGTINYTFYCNRSDAGINITSGYISKFDNVEPTGWVTSQGAKCSYPSPGVYTAKVIANQAGNLAEDRMTITVSAPSSAPQTLDGSLLKAIPSSGTTPFNPTLEATVSGTAQGSIHYQFDCTNDGSYEDDIINSTNPYSTKKCIYSTPGVYTARVHIERGTATPINRTATITVFSTPPVGRHDGVDNSGCRTWGWAYDPDTSSQSIEVHIYRDGPAGGGGLILNKFVANISRPDVNTAKGITGNHGFDVNLSSYITDGKSHSLYIYPIDTTTNLGSPSNPLSDTPRTIQCSAPTPIPGKTPPSVDIKAQ